MVNLVEWPLLEARRYIDLQDVNTWGQCTGVGRRADRMMGSEHCSKNRIMG